jgi:hypothetical protein
MNPQNWLPSPFIAESTTPLCRIGAGSIHELAFYFPAYQKPPLRVAMPIPPIFVAKERLQTGPCEGQLRPRRPLNAPGP